jgi:divalent metal cation (Fe/Co/Zn/Cd) transporter
LITFAIVYVLAGTVKQLYYRMMDAVDPTIVDEITNAAKSVSGVLEVHDVRVRWVGRELVAVMHVASNPKSTLEDAHALAMRVEDAVCHEVPAARLDIHMDPGTAKHHHAVVGTPLDPEDDNGDGDHHHDDSHSGHDHRPHD